MVSGTFLVLIFKKPELPNFLKGEGKFSLVREGGRKEVDK